MLLSLVFFVFIDTATTEIYTYRHTLSRHDALPIWIWRSSSPSSTRPAAPRSTARRSAPRRPSGPSSSARSAHSMRSEEHTSELQSLMRISYAVFCLKKKTLPYSSHNLSHKHHADIAQHT